MSFYSVGRKKSVKPLGIRVWNGNEDNISYFPGGSVSPCCSWPGSSPPCPHHSAEHISAWPTSLLLLLQDIQWKGVSTIRVVAEAAVERCTGFENYQKNQHCLFHEYVIGQYSGMGTNVNDQLPDPEMGDECYQAVFPQYKCFFKSIKQTSMAEKYMRY